ncbi:MAG: sel1 repeat family protein [Geminicoccaceae bacterium]|nr:sel1 repeat family protein [Geminicoccaceae bacterium]
MRAPAPPALLALALLQGCAGLSKPSSMSQERLLLAPRTAAAAGDYARAAEGYRGLALRGVVEAEYQLGRLYEDGKGVPQDDAVAADWFQRGADAGDAPSMRELGLKYVRGQGVGRDLDRGLGLLAAAAGKGDLLARYHRARLTLLNGPELGLDEAQAAERMRTIAREGSLDAQLELAGLYEEGRQVRRDPVEADRWYTIAGLQLERQAAGGDPKAMDLLAGLLARGRGVKQDVGRAFALWETAAARGRANALVDAAKLLETGTAGLSPDPARALAYRVRAARAGEAGSAYEAGKRFARGEGAPRDAIQAREMFQLASDLGDGRAYAWLGDLAAEEGSALYDPATAASWYGRAGALGDGKALFRLAGLHEAGDFPDASPIKALAYYRLAAAMGYGRGERFAARLAAAMSATDALRADAIAARWQAGRSAPAAPPPA